MKKIVVAVLGGTVLLLGLALLVLPGPGLVIIAAGLAILATEFLWAKHALRKARGAVTIASRKTRLGRWLRRRLSCCTKNSDSIRAEEEC
jgi:uncharacterized protein (TIGR02611 family)